MLIFYLNLNNRPDRRAFMEDQLQKAGLVAQRIPAVDVDTIGQNLSQTARDALSAGTTSMVELACNASHCSAYRKLLASDESAAMVLEDDVFLGPDLARALEKLEPMMQNIDILRLETRCQLSWLSARPEHEAGGYGAHRFYTAVWGAAGYIISRRAAQSVLNKPYREQQVLDAVFSVPEKQPVHGLKILQAVPGPVYHPRKTGVAGPQKSDLEKSREARGLETSPNLAMQVSRHARKTTRWLQRCCRIGFACALGRCRPKTIQFTGKVPAGFDEA